MKILAGKAVFFALLATPLFSIGCSRPAAGPPAPSPYDYADPQTLVVKAQSLGESEIARLAAAEMMYRNKVMVHFFALDVLGGTSPPAEIWIKLYRRFNSFDVVDIERTPSIMAPLKITIRFNYDRVGTREARRGRDDPDFARRAEDDVAFVVHDKESIVRTYFCNSRGDPISLPSPILARPNIWVKGDVEPKGSVWITDPEDLYGGRTY